MINLKGKRLMLLSPHADDAEIGCGGVMARAVAEGAEVCVLLATTGDIKFLHSNALVAAEERVREFCVSMNVLNIKNFKILTEGLDSKLNTYPIGSMVGLLDAAQNEFKPDILLLPLPSYHQDHKYCWEAGIAATRPSTSKHIPSIVAGYEYPLSFWGGNIGSNNAFGGIYFDVSDYWHKKVESLSSYKSQVDSSHGLISVSGAEALAKLRGLEIGVEYAEVVYSLKFKV